jgi:hypothetical protein
MARFKAGQHDWISLLDISGPFLSLTSLGKAFPMGLETLEKGLRQQFQLAYEEWYEQTDKGIHQVWITWVLKAVLEYDDEVLLTQGQIPDEVKFVDEASQDTVRPTFLVIGNEGDPRLPILAVPKGQKLGQPLHGHRWVASPNQRMQSLLKSSQLTHGLVTNGSEWTLIHVRESDATGYITFRSDVLADEEDLLRAFTSLLGLRRVVGAAEGESLADLLLASRDDEEELTLDLGRQVRASVELLAREMDRLDEETGRELLKETKDEDLYRGCLTVMMRLMFLLCAEERKLLPVDTSEAYSEHYAASTLLSQLEAEASEQGEEILERRHDAWMRLMANARLLHGGSPLPELQVTAYGGSLFDPAAYPFLESLKVNNRVTLHVLESLQYILVDGPTGKERRRVSFEALDVEQIGYVYEGLLDHTIHTAPEPVLGLIGKKTYEPELSLTELEALKGKRDFHKLLAKEITRSEQALKKLLDAPLTPERESGLRAACHGKADLFERIKPWGNLIRTDSMGRYQVYLEGSRYVSDSSERRGTGTHYTPRFLAEEMVQHTLEPLIVEGMAEGWPQEEWRKKSATELLNLRIADIAMGSGAFLVAVCRFLSAKVVEAWNEAEGTLRNEVEGARLVCNEAGELQIAFDPNHPDRRQVETSLGTLTVADPKRNEALPTDEEERLAVARSMIVDRCLYGVDINPMATEMAKLSLWLITMRKDKPFHFLDHALKCGDSLVGVTLDELKAFSLEKDSKKLGSVLLPWIPEAVERVKNLREQIRRWPGNTAIGVENRRILHARAEEDEVALRVAADLLLSDAFTKATSKAERQELEAARQARLAMLQERPNREKAKQLGSILGRPSFHFDLEFADVFAEGGFDAIVGNPPFVGGQKITDSMGTPFRDYIVARIAHGKKGSADLCAYFFLRAASITKAGGCMGLLATNTISEGDTREVGLDQLLKPSPDREAPTATAYRAVKSIKWPSKSANLECAKVWMRKGDYNGPKFLDGERVDTVSPMLDAEGGDRTPMRVIENESLSFQGSIVLGKGFVLEIARAQQLLAENPELSAVLFPYLNGEDLNNELGQRPSRWVINFHDWPLGRVGQRLPVSGEDVVEVVRAANPTRAAEWFPGPSSRWHDPSRDAETEERLQRQWLQMGAVPADYPHPVAADFPELLAIVQELVWPERLKQNDKGAKAKWWNFIRPRPELYATIRPMRRCLGRSMVSQYHNFAWNPTDIVIAMMVVVIASDRDAMFAAVQSMWHQVWTEKYSSSLETRQRYTPSDCFETFPLPEFTEPMDATGKALDDARRAAMDARQIGLTAVSKLMHNPTVRDADIEALRQAVIANDAAVSAAYGWDDLDLEHGFYDLGRGPRFTVSPAARKEMLRRLLAENHRRYAEEQAALKANPDAAKAKKGKAERTPPTPDGGLFGDGELSDGDDNG